MGGLLDLLTRNQSPLNDPRAMVGKAPKGRPMRKDLATMLSGVKTGMEILGPQADINDLIQFSKQAAKAGKHGRFAEALMATGAGAATIPMAFLPGSIGGIIKAFHGSPHKFGKFDKAFMGTGEGAQAFGKGHYFAENPGTARSYQTPNSLQDLAINKRLQVLSREMDEHAIPGQLRKYRNSKGDAAAAEYDHLLSKRAANQGHLYEVDINADPPDFLDWDKPVSEQSDGVQKALRTLPVRGPVSGPLYETGELARRAAENRSLPHFEITKEVGGYGIRVGSFSTNETAGQFIEGLGKTQETTDALRAAGIKGIKYLDQGSRAAGKGTSNFVVFDDSLIDILNRQ